MRFLKASRSYAHKRITAKHRPKKTTATDKQREQASDLRPRAIVHRGAITALRSCHEKEVLVEGPFGTGKTMGILAYLYELMDEHPGIRILMLRKFRASMNETVLKTWEEDVIPSGHPMLNGAQRENRRKYTHINGSTLSLGGLQDANAVNKVLSGEYDIIYCPEAIEIKKKDWETLKGRLRSFRLPWQQIIGDTNPGPPTHWLNVRCDEGQTVRLKSRHVDNPRYHDGTDWTPEGRDYVVHNLATMDGVRRLRYYLGIWAAQEGVVYEEFEDRHLVTERVEGQPLLPLPYEWRRIWVVDFGFKNPFVWQQWAIDGDGVMWREFEIYRTGRLLGEHAADIKAATAFKTPPPEVFLCDHDAQDRHELEALLGIVTVPANKAVTAGIDGVKARLKDKSSGKPRIVYCAGALVHGVDQDLKKDGRPTCTEQEFAVYRWKETPEGISKDEVVKEDDHGMDTTRYAVAHVDRIAEEQKGAVESFGALIPRRGGSFRRVTN